ncbi:MAG: hypothetical protein M3O15_08820 [Acidobacteriota bacterium]|nr:hypothetical protein [Acidobacteriota bacterium]
MNARLPGLAARALHPRRYSPQLHFTLLTLLTLLFLLLASGRRAAAATCTLDSVPAATLLLPYFEVDLDDPNGLTTLFSINNASATAALTHVVLWSDLAVPVLDFNVYLTGYDIQTINLRDVLVYGALPQTASAGQDPRDVISPKGVVSQDINYQSCNGQLPPPPLPAALLEGLQLSLTGRASPLAHNLCSGRYLADNVARGYITVDTVNNCTLRFPDEPGYFGASGNSDVTDQNLLWGAWYIVNTARSYAVASDMVAIEADAHSAATSTPGRYTFYGRYDGWTAIDHREPLATNFATQYMNSGGTFPTGTDLIVWRDPKVAQQPFPCPAVPGVTPAWYPLGQEGLTIWDEEEHPVQQPLIPIEGSPPPFVPFPAATQKVHVNSSDLPVPFSFGWMQIDLNSANPPAGPNPPVDPPAAQGYVIALHASNGHFAVAVDAYRLDSACAASHFVP